MREDGYPEILASNSALLLQFELSGRLGYNARPVCLAWCQAAGNLHIRSCWGARNSLFLRVRLTGGEN